MIVINDGQAMTLEELAQKVCDYFDKEDCYDGSCPAAAYCRHGHNGMIDFLREVLKK